MKNRLSRFLSMVICIAMIATLFAACGQNNANQQGNTATAQPSATSESTPTEAAKPKDVTLKLLVCWQGLTFLKPEDDANNTVAKVIKEKTGVTLETEWINTSEPEKLNLMFSTGEVPDMVMAPYWGGTDPNTVAIKKAAKDGLILPLDDLISQYGPNLQDAYTVGVAKDFMENDLKVDGKYYVLPMHTPATPEDTTYWAYTVFGRKDILQALNVDPGSVHTADDLYNLMVKIKNGGFKDTLGKPVIPASSWQNGWSYEVFLNPFKTRGFSSFIKDTSGNLTWGAFSENLDKEVVFMRKLIAEGLFDPEAFRQNDNVAKEKHITGGVALTGAHYQHIKSNLADTLYKEHPEMEYVPIGPIYDATGNAAMPETKRLSGLAGTAAMFLSATNKDPEATIKYLNFINSEEGKNLAYLGVEGVHWNMVDGKPKASDEWFQKSAADPKYSLNEGIGSIFTFGCSRLPNNMFAAAVSKDGVPVDETYEAFKKMYPMQVFDGYRIGYFENEYPQIDAIRQVTDWNVYKDAIERAYFAKTDDEALGIVNAYRDQLKAGGIDGYVKFMNEKAKTRTDTLN